jgi:hypothetical protein
MHSGRKGSLALLAGYCFKIIVWVEFLMEILWGKLGWFPDLGIRKDFNTNKFERRSKAAELWPHRCKDKLRHRAARRPGVIRTRGKRNGSLLLRMRGRFPETCEGGFLRGRPLDRGNNKPPRMRPAKATQLSLAWRGCSLFSQRCLARRRARAQRRRSASG